MSFRSIECGRVFYVEEQRYPGPTICQAIVEPDESGKWVNAGPCQRCGQSAWMKTKGAQEVKQDRSSVIDALVTMSNGLTIAEANVIADSIQNSFGADYIRRCQRAFFNTQGEQTICGNVIQGEFDLYCDACLRDVMTSNAPVPKLCDRIVMYDDDDPGFVVCRKPIINVGDRFCLECMKDTEFIRAGGPLRRKCSNLVRSAMRVSAEPCGTFFMYDGTTPFCATCTDAIRRPVTDLTAVKMTWRVEITADPTGIRYQVGVRCTRLVKREGKNVTCNRQVAEGEKICPMCIQFQKELYESGGLTGTCIVCGKRKPEEGSNTCYVCQQDRARKASVSEGLVEAMAQRRREVPKPKAVEKPQAVIVRQCQGWIEILRQESASKDYNGRILGTSNRREIVEERCTAPALKGIEYCAYHRDAMQTKAAELFSGLGKPAELEISRPEEKVERRLGLGDEF